MALFSDPWTWFCGGSKSPYGKRNCAEGMSCISLTYRSLWLSPGGSFTCIQHAIVCLGQLLLLLAFFTLLATSNSVPPGALTGSELMATFEVGSILYNVSSVLSGIIGLANVVVGIYLYFSESIVPTHEWVFLVVQGVAWLTIAVSLRIR